MVCAACAPCAGWNFETFEKFIDRRRSVHAQVKRESSGIAMKRTPRF
jgi:hypothetical protein